MTSDGISAEDWDELHGRVLEVVNADEEDEDRCRRDLRSYLAELKTKYGDRPSLLSTEADFETDTHAAERLYLRAFDLAVNTGDEENIREIALSLAEHYARDCLDRAGAMRWLDISRSRLRPGNESDADQFRRVVRAVEELTS